VEGRTVGSRTVEGETVVCRLFRHGREPDMHARTGDRIHIKGARVGDHEQVGDVLEVRGARGEPPYLVRFQDGHEGLIYPGPDCVVEVRTPQGTRG